MRCSTRSPGHSIWLRWNEAGLPVCPPKICNLCRGPYLEDGGLCRLSRILTREHPGLGWALIQGPGSL